MDIKYYNFDAREAAETCIDMLRMYFEECNRNPVIGISGGKDSTIITALLCEALRSSEKKNTIIGVTMPCHDNQDSDCEKIIDYFGIKRVNIDIGAVCNFFIEQVNAQLITDPIAHDPEEPVITAVSAQTKINLPARLRMSALYAVSQSHYGRVINTCNLSENFVGYSTRFGDSVGDISPIGNFTVTEVLQIGDYLGIPKEWVHKTPSDGLCGKTDEEQLGFTYDEVDRIIRKNGEGVSSDHFHKIMELHKKNAFKEKPMETFDYPADIFYQTY